jgi:lysophospholipase L1-like esterase
MISTESNNLLVKLEALRIEWLKKHGSIYFPFWDMVLKYPWLLLFNAYVLARARLYNNCIIHVIGDSHVKPFVFKSPFLVHHISQATAYNLIKDNSTTNSQIYLKKFLSKIDRERDIVLLVFGEIDARVHIYLKHGESGKTISVDSLIGDTVLRYGQVIKRIKDDGVSICIHGIPPASSNEFITALPFTGKPRERSEISKKFNDKLRKYCTSIGVPYIDVQSIAADGDGFIKKSYRADDVHCNTRIVPFCRQAIEVAYKDAKKFH